MPSRQNRIAFSSLLICLFGLGSLAHGQTTRPHPRALTARQIAQKTLSAVVVLFAEDAKGNTISLGSGFLIGPGLIATNYHVIENAESISAKLIFQKKRIKVKRTVGVDEDKDLALLMVEGISVRSLPLGDVSKVAIGDEIYVAGNPEGFEGTFSQGIISGFRGKSYIQITAPISHGSSGGPVLNSRGEVIGIAVGLIAGGQNLNFAISASELLAFKNEALLRYKQLKDFDFSGLELPKNGTEQPPDLPAPGLKNNVTPITVAQWEDVAMTDDRFYLMNINRIKTDEGTIQTWVKSFEIKEKDKRRTQIEMSEYHGSPYVLSLDEFDCKKQMMKTNFIATYEENGKPSVSGTIKDEWKYVPPGTIAHNLLDAACKQ